MKGGGVVGSSSRRWLQASKDKMKKNKIKIKKAGEKRRDDSVGICGKIALER